MKKTRYTEEQIAFALKQAETGTPVAEVIRRMGVSEQTFYRWKKVYGGLGVGELRRVKQLEDENRKLKQLVAEPRAPAGNVSAQRDVVDGLCLGRAVRWSPSAGADGGRRLDARGSGNRRRPGHQG
ncbi:transposase-like protein [Sphingomonas vulcanisoli]|nr:transposase-like protein [Sphingomonas vulcanisoli]